jgi:nucleolar complex protein 3
LEGLARYAHLINQDFFGDLLEALKDLIGHAETGDDLEEEQEEDEETTRNLTREALLCIITALLFWKGKTQPKPRRLSVSISASSSHIFTERCTHCL